MFSFRSILFVLSVSLFGVTVDGVCQDADSGLPKTRAEGEKCLREEHVCEQLDKLRIAHEKKEHGELLSRAEKALKLSEDLERSISSSTQITEQDRERLQDFEKLVRKIRSELGGKDIGSDSNDEDQPDDATEEILESKEPTDVVTGFRILRESTVKLVTEIRKTTRFTISAAAINSSNAVLKLTRILRFWR